MSILTLACIVAACIFLALFVSTRTLWRLCGVLAVAIVLLSLWNHAEGVTPDMLMVAPSPTPRLPLVWQATAQGMAWEYDRVFANGMEK